MIVRIYDIMTDVVVHEYSPESSVRVPLVNDRVWVPDNGDAAYVVQERHFNYGGDSTVLRLYALGEDRSP